jgi:hypothetical protein
MTRYFQEQVLRKRPYLTAEWCNAIVIAPLRHSAQRDGRIRWWGCVIPGREVLDPPVSWPGLARLPTTSLLPTAML